MERLQARRATQLEFYPFRMMDHYGLRLPTWARVALSFVTRGGLLSHLLEVGLPLAMPFFYKKQAPFFERLIQRIFSPKA